MGGREHFTLDREIDNPTSCAPLRFESPPEMMHRPEVPSSTQSADEMHRCRVAHNLPHLSPVGINQDAHRIGSRIPLGPRSPSSRTPEMSPRIPFPPGRADGSADCLSLHTLVHGRLTVGVKRQFDSRPPQHVHVHVKLPSRPPQLASGQFRRSI